MELLSEEYQTIRMEKTGKVKLKFLLSETPTTQWTRVFNRYSRYINSIENTSQIVVEQTPENLIGVDVLSHVLNYISLTDKECNSDLSKSQIILEHMQMGAVVVHDSLTFEKNGEEIASYQKYLTKINNMETIL